MSQIMKAFTGVFIVLYMMVASIGLLGAFFEVLYAQNLHAAIVDELENSNYAKPIITDCFKQTQEAGYELELTLYTYHDSFFRVKNIEEIPSNITDIRMARVVLNYPFRIVFFDIDMEQSLYGYAR